MLNASSNPETTEVELPQMPKSKILPVPWNPWIAVLFIGFVYYFSQFFSGAVVSLYPWLMGWSSSQTSVWLNESVLAQFSYVLIALTFMIASIYIFLKKFKSNFNLIGLVKPKLKDVGLGLLAAPLYYAVFVISVYIISFFVPSLDINQVQNIGFTDIATNAQLVLTFISLVVLPPFVEEIMFRGFLYSSLKKAMPKVASVVITSLIFASAHLPGGGAAGLLYIAAVDTFILSLVLIYLRERTGSLWASITLHGVKNGIAFIALFILNAR